MTRRELHLCPGLGLTVLIWGLAGCVSAGGSATLSTEAHWVNPLAISELVGFEDVTERSGVQFEHRPLELEGPRAHYMLAATAGVAAADFDGDGAIDLFFTQTAGPNSLYWGRSDVRWLPAELPPFMALDDLACSATTAVDFDGDGLLDLSVMAPGELRLLRNLGDRSFEDVTDDVGLSGEAGFGSTLAWADIDGDGDLDLYAGRHLEARDDDEQPRAEPDRLWRNDGGRFVDATSALGLSGDDGAALHALWKDFDQDGDLDLFQVNDFGAYLGNSHLFENLGEWRFVDRMADSGIGVLEYPMGAAARDLDGDGLLDLWISDIDRTTVMRGVSPFAFVDASAAWGSGLLGGPGETSWSVLDLDVDGDGWVDIYQAFGPLVPFEAGAPPDPPQSDKILLQDHNSGGTRFVPLGDLPDRLLTSNTRGVALADLDHNGVLDLVVTQVEGQPTVLLGRDTGAARLTVVIRDSRSRNHYGIGAQVTIEAAGRTQRDTFVAGGRGSFSSSDPLLAFGLGESEQVDRLTVLWPDGEQDEFGPLCADCKVTIRR